MSPERELKRHVKVLEDIKNASNKEELPNVTLSSIARYLASNASFDKVHISQTAFKPVTDALAKYNYFNVPEVKIAFMQVLRENYEGRTEEEYEALYTQILEGTSIGNYLVEIEERAKKLEQLEELQDLENHKQILNQIKDAFEIKELPSVGRGILNRRIQEDTKTDYTDRIAISKLQEISDCILSKKDEQEIRKAILKMCEQFEANGEETELVYEQISSQILSDNRLGYIVEEIEKRDAKVLEIYKDDHERTMEKIKEAKRISQLPQNLTFSNLAGYLSGNTTIYPKGDKISTTELKDLTALLLDGKTFDDEEVKEEVKKIAEEKYPENAEEANDLLYEKISKLPRTNYMVEEINYSQSRQEEFIGRSCSNVNVYFIPNPNTPVDGGRFYNCYINRVDNLDLGEILQLDLESIVPPGMDVDSIEWYVQEKYDPTFKAAGGIILNKDETIGTVSVFKPSDGTVGITPEEKEKYEQLKELKTQVSEIIKDRKEKMKQFADLQKSLLAYMDDQDAKLAELEEKISQIQGEEELGQAKPENKQPENNGEER